MKDNKLLKVLWGIVLAIFLCSAIFVGISYFSGGDSSSSKKSSEKTTSSTSKIVSLHLMIKVMSKNIEKVRIQIITLQVSHLKITLQVVHQRIIQM